MSSAGFERIKEGVGRYQAAGQRVLMPHMSYFGSRFTSAAFRAFGASAEVMETGTGLALGREFTSGKECFPCQVTLGDVLHHLQGEKERLGAGFDPRRYLYFLPEAGGPCRFGMYNKYQRLVLDSFPEFRDVRIINISTTDGYSFAGLFSPEQARPFKKLMYFAFLAGDVLDRMIWRVRPYEREAGSMEALSEEAALDVERFIEREGSKAPYPAWHRRMAGWARRARALIDPALPRRPLIAVIGEIYLRSHRVANQDLVRRIERYGGEVVVASIGEWILFVSRERVRRLTRGWRQARRQGQWDQAWKLGRGWLGQWLELKYLLWRQRQLYEAVEEELDLVPDHAVAEWEKMLAASQLVEFDAGTEAVPSVGGALKHLEDGIAGIVNAYPFTCMPSTVCNAVLKPLLARRGIPYLEAPFDDSVQPNQDIALRTFLFQASQKP